MAKITLKVKVNDSHFQYQSSVSQDACLVQIYWFQSQICDDLLGGLADFIKLWVKMAKWPWRSRSMTYIFNTSWEYTLIVQIWWFQLKSMMSYRADTGSDKTP